MTYRTNYNRVAGLGAAKEGTHHWWLQRITSIALVPLCIIFILFFGSSLGEGRDAVIAAFSNPLAAISTMLLMVVGFHHLQQGLQVIIEDYVHTKRTAAILLILNILFCWAFAATGIFAVARISFGLAS